MDEIPQEQNDEDLTSGLTTGKLLILSIVSANIYLFLSLLILKYWQDGWLPSLFVSDFSLISQIGIGLGAGSLASAVIYFMILHSPISDVISDYSVFKALSKADFSIFDNTQISFFAGVGEELLFRGAIQPLLGNTLTSIIFIGIHGYFKFRSPGHILFGVMMFGLSFMLGLLFEHIGLIAAMAAHAIYDLIMLQLIQRRGK
jgi:membrane protease YdiL (CAAX protease family)